MILSTRWLFSNFTVNWLPIYDWTSWLTRSTSSPTFLKVIVDALQSTVVNYGIDVSKVNPHPQSYCCKNDSYNSIWLCQTLKITSLLYWGVFVVCMKHPKQTIITNFVTSGWVIWVIPKLIMEVGIQISTYVQWPAVHYNTRCPVLVLLQRTNDSLQIYVDFSTWTYFAINIWSIGWSTDEHSHPFQDSVSPHAEYSGSQ